MIIGKIMMIQNSSSKESVEYLISKKIMELKGNIKDYTLNRFIEEVGVSKTSMVRYLKNININKFSYFKNVMYEEYMHAEVDMKKMKKVIKNNFPHIQTQIFKKIMVCKRIVILGDGNRFALLLCQKALTYLGYPCEIPVYLGSEEEIIDQFHLKEDDLVIIVSLHETYDDLCTNRSVFYQNANYLDVEIKPKIGFIGVAPKDNHLYFNYNINQESFDKSMNELQVFFLNLVQYILYKNGI